MIAFPGRKGPRAQTRMLARHVYGVLLFDRRGHGEREGDPHAFGWEGEKDIKAAPPPPLMQDIIGRIAPRPVFIIWAPQGVDTETLNPAYFNAAGEPKTLWAIPELAARPAEYERRVVGFFNNALLR